MATLIAPPSRPAPKINDGHVRTLDEIFNLKAGLLATYNVEREEEIEILGDCLISGNDPLFLGPPGVGKTHILELLMMCVKGTGLEEFFDILLAKDMSSDDVLGVRSLPAMKAGRVERIMDGMLPRARFATLDEIFKASPPLQNSLLDILARRKLKIGGVVYNCAQLLLILMASNEYPSREDLGAFKDRIVPVTCWTSSTKRWTSSSRRATRPPHGATASSSSR
jgi:MoxR-like ATPase